MERIIIKNADDIKAFIEAQNEARQHACALFLASRAALRVAPYAINFATVSDQAEMHNFTAVFLWICV